MELIMFQVRILVIVIARYVSDKNFDGFVFQIPMHCANLCMISGNVEIKIATAISARW